MKRFLFLFATLAAVMGYAEVSSTNGSVSINGGSNTYHADGNPVVLGTFFYGQQATAADTIGAYLLPAHAFTVDQLLLEVLGTVGTGAGNLVIRISDGTRNCDTTCACSTTCHTAGSKRPTMSGTCAFPSSSQLTVTVQTQGCSQSPGIWNVSVEGRWQ